MTCKALNGVKLCTACASTRASDLCQEAYDSGHWHSLLEEDHGNQILDVVSTNASMVVDKETCSCAHIYTAELARAAQSMCVSTETWPLSKVEFAKVHCTKHNLWYHPKRKWLRRTTPLRLYDRDSILARMKAEPQKGLSITEIVKEYPEAYNDITGLVDSGSVLVYKETAWLRQPLGTSQ